MRWIALSSVSIWGLFISFYFSDVTSVKDEGKLLFISKATHFENGTKYRLHQY